MANEHPTLIGYVSDYQRHPVLPAGSLFCQWPLGLEYHSSVEKAFMSQTEKTKL